MGTAILAGGGSRRMGHPKWNIPVGGEPLIKRLYRILHPCSDSVVAVMKNFDQSRSLSNLVSGIEMVFDDPDHEGPLAGLMAGLRFLEERGCATAFVVGCDYPLVTDETIAELQEGYAPGEIRLFEDADRLQPMPGLYPTRCWETIRDCYQQGIRGVYQFLHAAESRGIEVKSVPLACEADELPPTFNMNTPEDVERLETYLNRNSGEIEL